jgi:DNA-binding NtrC family response regulator
MDSLTRECLGLLCRLCGAESARLRLRSASGGDCGTFFEFAAAAVPGGADEFILTGPGASPLRETATEGTAWRLRRGDAEAEWTMERSLGGLDISLDLVMNERLPGLVGRRLSAAGELAPLLELIAPALAAQVGAGDIAAACEGPPFDPPIYGSDPAVADLRRLVRRMAASDIPVLITGESGTGKELVARNVHTLGPRREGPLVSINCMEMPDQLLQGELFGSAKGSYTGADRDRAGLIESARGGTFFLDEIGEMSLHLQAALLRVVQEREVRRIGESRFRPVNVRFVFATNRDLAALVREGSFRRDLFYRISAAVLTIPPLRGRRGDIAPLAAHFLRSYTRRLGHGPRTISPGALSRLSAYPWPGNVRELRNEIERAAAMHPRAQVLTGAMLSLPVPGAGGRGGRGGGADEGSLHGALEELERRMIVEALGRWGGNRTATAKALGITRQGLLKKLRRMGIDPDRFRPGAAVTAAGPPSS